MLTSPVFIALLLTILTFPLVPLMHMAFLRIFQHGNMKTLFFSAILYGIIWFSLAWELITNEQFLFWFIAGICFMGFLILGYAECFSMLSRGFSLQILVDIYREKTRTLEELLAHYGGKGAQGLMERRIHNLLSLKMIEEKNGVLSITQRGFIAGKIGNFVKNILKLGKGG